MHKLSGKRYFGWRYCLDTQSFSILIFDRDLPGHVCVGFVTLTDCQHLRGNQSLQPYICQHVPSIISEGAFGIWKMTSRSCEQWIIYTAQPIVTGVDSVQICALELRTSSDNETCEIGRRTAGNVGNADINSCYKVGSRALRCVQAPFTKY